MVLKFTQSHQKQYKKMTEEAMGECQFFIFQGLDSHFFSAFLFFWAVLLIITFLKSSATSEGLGPPLCMQDSARTECDENFCSIAMNFLVSISSPIKTLTSYKCLLGRLNLFTNTCHKQNGQETFYLFSNIIIIIVALISSSLEICDYSQQ